jgi:S1-C subfamily serine protease
LARFLLIAGLSAALSLPPAPAVAGPRDERSAEGVGYREIKLGLAHVGLAGYRDDLIAVQWLGSGALVGRDCRVATAKHVLADIDRSKLVVRFLHPTDPDAVRTFQARVAWEDPDTDLALLEFAGSKFDRQFCRNKLRALPLIGSFDPVSLTGRTVLVAGFPVLERDQPREIPILRRGIVASSELQWDGRPMLLLDLTGVPGFSGSPVILEDSGEVIGVVFGPGRTRRQYDLEWATPMTRVELERATSAPAPAGTAPGER